MLFGIIRQTWACFWLFSVVLAEKNVVWHFLKTCLLWELLDVFSACLAYIKAIWCILPSDLAYLVHVNLESLILFMWVLCDCILLQIFCGIVIYLTYSIKRLCTRSKVIKNYGMVHICISITFILLFQTFVCIFNKHFQ